MPERTYRVTRRDEATGVTDTWTNVPEEGIEWLRTPEGQAADADAISAEFFARFGDRVLRITGAPDGPAENKLWIWRDPDARAKLGDTAPIFISLHPAEDYASARGLPLHHARRELLETLCEATYVGTAGARGTRERWAAVHEPTRHEVTALVSREETPAGRPLAVVVEIRVRGV